MSLLADFEWKAKYDSDDRSLVGEFFVPALSSAQTYDRTTGYFRAGVLTLAARGIEGLVRNGGRMRLVVGWTLGPEEEQAICKGESLRETLAASMLRSPLEPQDDDQRAALELLSWLVARGTLEVKVAIPCDASRRPVSGAGLFHEKAGIVEDKTGARLAFNGSINETPAGWAGNWESFHVFTSWGGEDSAHRVQIEGESFQRLWKNKVRQCVVVDVPAAVQGDLLRFLPAPEALPRRLGPEASAASEAAPPEANPSAVAPSMEPPATDLRALVWSAIRDAPTWTDGGERVGEATSAVIPWPHQVRAFHRLYDHWPPRLLIADEVGLGKTIEAGLLLRQAVLAGRARRVLVLAPKAVLGQWQLELREKFNLRWPIYDGQRLVWPLRPGESVAEERKVGRSEWSLEPFVLASSQLMRRVERQAELLAEAPPWDLVVLDEAHHARRKGAGLTKDKSPNRLLALMRGLRPKSAGLLLLTATPMQVHPLEVFDLLGLLGLPEAWSEAAFVDFHEKAGLGNPSHEDFEELARLFRASEAAFGELTIEEALRHLAGGSRLGAKKVLQALRDPARTARKALETDRRKAAVRIMRAASPVARLVSRHTRELLRSYFRAGKISTPIAERDVKDEFIEMSAAEQALYAAVEEYISTTYDQAAADERNAVGFVMTIYRRRMASSFQALATTLEGRLKALAGQGPLPGPEDEDLADDDDEGPDDAGEAAALEREALKLEERVDLERLLAVARRLPTDTKATRLLRDVLPGLRAAGYQQTIVFTQYTDTMDFLRGCLQVTDLRVLCYSGRGGERLGLDKLWHPCSRDDVKREFRKGAADLLLCTDAAAEGLNFQFCGALINYDMPWNPMRVEQRIGRIDRLGQRHPVIRIVNLHYEDTIETDVYRALRERIGLFSRFVGKLQPILSSLPRSIQGAALAKPGERDRQRADLVSRLEGDIRTAEDAGFDLDAITEADLVEPERPAAPYGLDELDLILHRPDILPPGIEAKPLGPKEYAYRAPGMAKPVRVTTDPDYFDDQPGSLELWSPGSPLFPEAGELAGGEAAVPGPLAPLLRAP